MVGIKLKEKPDDLDWQDVVNHTGLDCHYDSLRKAMQPETYGAYAIYEYMIDKIIENESKNDNSNDDAKIYISELQNIKREIYKERTKLRDEKNEYMGWLREQARFDLLGERMEEAVTRLLASKPRIIPKPIEFEKSDISTIVGMADVHWGTDFKVEGFNGEMIAEYDTKIAEKRIWELRDNIFDFCSLHNISKISLVELGDSINGLIHLSGIKANKGNIVDDIVDYSELFIDFIDSLSEKLVIDVYTSNGNHSDLKILSDKRLFKGENLEKIFARMLIRAMEKNPNVTVHNNVRGMNYFKIEDKKIFTVHGQNEKNLFNSIKEYEDIYKIEIDYLMVGHLHNKMQMDINGTKEVIRVRSIMGGNDYSIEDLKKSSQSGAIIFTIQNGYGIKDTRDIKFIN